MNKEKSTSNLGAFLQQYAFKRSGGELIIGITSSNDMKK